MIKEPRLEELGRDNLYDEYFRREMKDGNANDVRPDAIERMNKNKTYFDGKTQLEIMIKGNILFDRDYKKMFTFLNKTYDIREGACGEAAGELINAIRDLDEFNCFMAGEPVNYFSKIENEYVNYTRVLNAKVYMELT